MSNLDNLLASRLVRGARYCTLINDATAAGVVECYSAAASGPHPTLEKLLKEVLHDSPWPKLRSFRVPLLARDHTVMHGDLSFLLPHELLDTLVSLSRGGQEALTDIAGLDNTTNGHVLEDLHGHGPAIDCPERLAGLSPIQLGQE
eukprot:1584296-Amphidinium_carterae.1